jgi:hypothetical protein
VEEQTLKKQKPRQWQWKNDPVVWQGVCPKHGRGSGNIQGVNDQGLIFRCPGAFVWNEQNKEKAKDAAHTFLRPWEKGERERYQKQAKKVFG